MNKRASKGFCITVNLFTDMRGCFLFLELASGITDDVTVTSYRHMQLFV